MVTGSFQLDSDWSSFNSENRKSSTEKITSTADCVVYHVKFPKYARRPDFTTNFLRGVRALEVATRSPVDGVPPLLPYYRFFDEFGTHWMEQIQMGARFGITTLIEESELDKLTKSGLSIDVSASLAWNKLAEDVASRTCGNKLCTVEAEEEEPKSWSDGLVDAVGTIVTKVMNKKAPSLERDPTAVPADVKDAVRALAPRRSRVIRSKSWVVDGTDGSWPRRVESEFLGFSTEMTAGRPARSERGDGEGSAVDAERTGAVPLGASGSVGGTHNTNTEEMSKFTAKSTSVKIISLGAKPSTSTTEWAQQTMTDNMPIKYNVRPRRVGGGSGVVARRACGSAHASQLCPRTAAHPGLSPTPPGLPLRHSSARSASSSSWR